tara:strand:- start:128880 stop:129701 length:822 start_codon:yes stop_codon:yes gene_type:complete
MKYAICNETFGDWPLRKALDLAVQSGYTGWEIAPFMLCGSLSAYTSSQRDAYRKEVEAAGLSVVGLHWLLAKTQGLHLTSPDSQTRERTTAYLIELARLCHDLGGNVMVLGSPQQRNYGDDQTGAEAMAMAADVLSGVVETLVQCDVRIALEPLGPQEGNFLNTAAEARELAGMIGSDAIQLHLDVKAMSSEAEPIDAVIRDNGDAMIHFHANDPNRQGPGMGDVDFVPIFQALKDVGYDGWVSVEVFDYSPGVETLVGQSMSNMRKAEQSVH